MGKFRKFAALGCANHLGDLHAQHTHRVKCLSCSKTFVNHAGLSSHTKRFHNPVWNQQQSQLAQNKMRRRHQHTKDTQRLAVHEVLMNPGLPMGRVGDRFGIPASCLSRYVKESTSLEFWKECKKTQQEVESKAQFCAAEQELNQQFLHRRKVLGFYVDGHWLRHKMRRILRIFRPKGWDKFKYSNGWLYRFCSRYRISSQARTDQKCHSDEYRVEQILKQLSSYLELQKSRPAVDSHFGRFSPDRHWHVDQVPMPFSFPRARSLNPIGTPCKIKGLVRSSFSKRQCSVNVTTRAVGEQVVPPVIIFYGLGQKYIKDEILAWAKLKHVVVYFQQKAWCDSTFFHWFLLNVFNKNIRESGELGEQLLFLDNLGSHMTESNIALMKELLIVPLFLALNCTDVAAPIDHHVGCYLKVKVKGWYELDLEQNYDLWRGGVDDVEAANPHEFLNTTTRRIKMAQWLDEAWGELRVMDQFLLSSFVSTGCLMGLNGENEIKMRGLTGVDGVLQKTLTTML